MHDLREFLQFQKYYIFSRLMTFGKAFEKVKDLIVAFLIVKRGKYSNSFLNTTFLLLVAAVMIGAPTIAENNPFNNQIDQEENRTSSVIAFDPYSNPLSTVISVKGRDKSKDYPVASGDTLDSIAKKFDVSVDTIKWANNLKNDTIKPGQVLSIPPVSGIVHKVIAGENIYSIAKKYHTDAQNVLNFPYNDFADLTTFALSPGQTLVVPGGKIEEEKPRVVGIPSYAAVQSGVKGSSNFIWPTSGGITQYPVWYHVALDIANNASPPVVASDTGTVVFAAWDNTGYGLHVIVDHGNGYRTLYGHLSRLSVSAGQAVSQGQQLGIMGSTGRSTGIHLHFEIRSGGGLLNPLNFLK